MGIISFFKKNFINLVTAFALFGSSPIFFTHQIIPVTATVLTAEAQPSESSLISLQDFAEALNDGKAGVIKGLYADETFSLRVVQQPSGNPGFVSSVDGTATLFGMASKNNVTGMLAHNYSSGRHFFLLKSDDVVNVVYGDGSIKAYKITQIKRYQALSPNSASSDFIDLDTSEKLSAARLFGKVYTGTHHLTLQTCIQEGSEDSWGRLFIIAEPIEA